VQEDGAQVLVFFELAGCGVQQVDVALFQGETVFCQLDRRGNHLGALEGAVLAQGQFHARHGPRHADSQVTLGAEAFDDVAVLVQVHIGGSRQRGFFAEVEEGLAPVRQLHGHETAAAQVARRRVHHRQRIAYGHGRIHRVAPGLEHIHAHMSCQMLSRHHHAIFTGHRSLGSSLYTTDRQHQGSGNQGTAEGLVFHPWLLGLLRCTKIARRQFNPQRNGVFITELVGHRTDRKKPIFS